MRRELGGPWGQTLGGVGVPLYPPAPPEQSCGHFPAALRHIQPFPADPDTPGMPRGWRTRVCPRLSPPWAAEMGNGGVAPAEPLPEPRGDIGIRPPDQRLDRQTDRGTAEPGAASISIPHGDRGAWGPHWWPQSRPVPMGTCRGCSPAGMRPAPQPLGNGQGGHGAVTCPLGRHIPLGWRWDGAAASPAPAEPLLTPQSPSCPRRASPAPAGPRLSIPRGRGDTSGQAAWK